MESEKITQIVLDVLDSYTVKNDDGFTVNSECFFDIACEISDSINENDY